MGVPALVVLWSGTFTGTGNAIVYAPGRRGISQGQILRLRARCRFGGNRPVGVSIEFINEAFTEVVGGSAVSWSVDEYSNAAGTVKEVLATVPAGAAWWRVIAFSLAGAAWSGVALVSDVQVHVATDTGLVVPGAIVTDKLAAGAVVADKIAAGAVTAEKVVAGAIETDKLAAGAITTAKMAAGAITADTIASNAITAAKIEAGAVITAKLAAGAVTASTIAAGAIVAEKLAVGSPHNLIWNSCCTYGVEGWSSWGAEPATLFRDANGHSASWANDWSNPTYNSGVAFRGSLTASGWFDAQWTGNTGGTGYRAMPISGGEWVEAQARISAHSCRAGVFVKFADSAGNWITESVAWSAYNDKGPADGVPTNKTRLTVKAQAPSNARYASMSVRADANGAARTNAYLFWTMALLARTTQNAAPMDWTPGGVITLEGGILRPRTIAADKIVALAITANELASGSVTTAKLVAGAVTAGEIAANAVTAEKVNAGAITTAKIAAGAVTAAEIASGAITTGKLSVASPSGNVIWNSCLPYGREGWAVGGTYPPSFWGAVSTHLLNNSWRLEGRGSGAMNRSGIIPAGGYMDLYWFGSEGAPHTPVVAGEWWEFQARVQTHRCACVLIIVWYNAAGAYITETNVAEQAGQNAQADAKYLDRYALKWGKAQAPAGATRAMCMFRVVGANVGATGSEPYMMFTEVLFARSHANQTEPSPWGPGGITELNGGMLRTRTIAADRIVAGAITATEIAASAITADKLAANSVVAGKIAAGAISATEIAAGAIVASKLASSTLITSSAQLGTAVVNTAQIADASISAAKIGNAQITNAKIGNLEVDTIKIANGAISSTAAVISGTNFTTDTWVEMCRVLAGDSAYVSTCVVQAHCPGSSYPDSEGNPKVVYFRLRHVPTGGIIAQEIMYGLRQNMTLASISAVPVGGQYFAVDAFIQGGGISSATAGRVFLTSTVLKK